MAIEQETALGTCMAFECFEQAPKSCRTTLTFTVPETAYEEYERLHSPVFNPNKTLFSNSYGSIIDAEPGTIFVGGHYVCQMSKFTYAYDFASDQVALDRDRRIPSDFDIEWAASHISNRYPKLNKAALRTRDLSYTDSFPQEVIDRLAPKAYISDAGIAGLKVDGKFVKAHHEAALLQDPKLQKQIARLRFTLNKRRSPAGLLKDFEEKHQATLRQSSIWPDWLVLKRKAADWRYKPKA